MSELALRGVSAAPGVTVGPAIVLERVAKRHSEAIAPERREAEASRARDALRLAAAELEAIASELRDAGRRADADIVETGVLMALDPGLQERVESLVDSGLAAADALLGAADGVASELEAVADPTLALRADDVRSVGRRAAARAAGADERSRAGIVVARSVGPADVAELAEHATGFALAAGGVTSHAAIVARSLGLPMVIALGEDLLGIADGEELVIDGDGAVVIRHPDAVRVTSARGQAEKKRIARDIAISRRAEPAVTRDGRRIHVLANASTVPELDEALRQGAEGIGLMRTELLFLDATGWPEVEQQVHVMRPVLGRLAGQVATVRLFDFGGDKTPPFLRGVSARGIEILLGAPEVLRSHVTAVLEAGRGTRLRILVPMVGAAGQMRAVRELAGADVQVGAMIETPQAAAAADAIAAESDFLSIGTNDLTQLTLGLDREQSRRAPVLDARVLRLIADTMRAAQGAKIVVDVCGEAASDPNAMRVMIGLGADELSVAAARVGQVREWVRGVDYAGCRKEAELLLDQAGDASRERV